MNRDRPRPTLSLTLTWELGAAAGIRGSKLYLLLRSTWALGHNDQVGYGKSDAHFNILVTNVRHNETITTKLRRVHDSRARTIRERGCRTGPKLRFHQPKLQTWILFANKGCPTPSGGCSRGGGSRVRSRARFCGCALCSSPWTSEV